VLERKAALISAVVDGTSLAPELTGDVLDELQRALRSISSGLTDSPDDIDDDEVVERLRRQARLEIDGGSPPGSAAVVRTPEETAALKRALEALVKALSGPSVERYRFASASHPGVEYEITVDGADVACTCPGFEYRGQCRHARDIKAALAVGKHAPAGYVQVR
jgi:SWIM zinc finger